MVFGGIRRKTRKSSRGRTPRQSGDKALEPTVSGLRLTLAPRRSVLLWLLAWRLGGKSEIAVAARVLAAPSQELETHLREELYYRLSVFQIVIPPRREHKEDIPPISEALLRNLNKKHGTRVTGAAVRDEANAAEA
jgi:hypothetical protein